MPNYRRAFVPGGCWFFTVNLLERRQTSACRSYRCATERRRQDAKELSFQYRCRCRLAGSSACGIVADPPRGSSSVVLASSLRKRSRLAWCRNSSSCSVSPSTQTSGLIVRRVVASARCAMDQKIVHLSGIGVHQNGPAASAAIVRGVSASNQDWRRVYGVPPKQGRLHNI